MTLEEQIAIVDKLYPGINKQFDYYAIHNTPDTEEMIKYDLMMIKQRVGTEAYEYYNHIYQGIRGLRE